MSKLLALQSAETLVDIAALLDTPTSTLIYTLYKAPAASKYTTFDIPKKNGGVRTIHAPVGKLKIYQTVLAKLLYECADELDAVSPRKPLSHGFRRGRSIVSNATQHKNRRFVLNLDLEDFFPTFHFGRVRGFFIKDRGFALKPGCATILAQLACFQGSLPQGSPCSPIIADLIAHVLDLRLVRLAKQCRVTYSRYADDLTFSTNAKAFPTALATGGTSTTDPWILAAPLVNRITSTGFVINATKTRMHVAGSRQTVTGLTVNEKVNISQAYWRGARSMCYALFQTGTYHRHAAMPGDESATITDRRTLRGILAHIRHVKNVSPIKPPPAAKALFFGQRLHADFHFYDYFVALDRPLVITEGKTDPVYLRNAIRHRSVFQPQLGQTTLEGFRYGIGFFNHENTVAEILKMTGGSDQLKTFAQAYRKQLARYAHKPLKHPVIIMLDNDSALTAFSSMLAKTYGVTVNQKTVMPFYHLTDNLYLVKTPEIGAAGTSCIEDMFDAKTKAIPLDGKIFHADEKTYDSDKHINKVAFAKKVVAQNAETIEWAGFDNLLRRVTAVLADYTPPLSPFVIAGPAAPLAAPLT